MDAVQRIARFRKATEWLFDGATFLVGVSNPGLALALKLAAVAVPLLLEKANARLEAVLNAPVDVANTGYDRPGPDEVLAAFSTDPRWPGVEVAFAAEVERGDFVALQHAHRALFTLLELDRPVLRAVFDTQIAARDWRAVVEQWPDAIRALNALSVDARTRGALERFARLFAGAGQDHDNPQARARIAGHWEDLKSAALEALR